MGRTLAIGAHPDDVEVGCAGMLQRGSERRIVVLSDGARGGDGAQRKLEAIKAAELLGASVVTFDLPDTRIATATAIGVLENEIRSYKPDVVLTMSAHDTHQDHRAVHRATLVATRDLYGVVLAYCTPSSAERFRPVWFATLTEEELNGKLAAIACHRSQTLRPYMRPEYARGVANYWAQVTRCQSPYVEPYEVLRVRESR